MLRSIRIPDRGGTLPLRPAGLSCARIARDSLRSPARRRAPRSTPFPTEDHTPQALWQWNRSRALTDGVRRLSDLPEDEARAALYACCASRRWVERMLSQRPFKNREEVFEAAEHIWHSLGPEDRLEALAGNERPGSRPDAEPAVAALEQPAITRARLEKLLTL